MSVGEDVTIMLNFVTKNPKVTIFTNVIATLRDTSIFDYMYRLSFNRNTCRLT